MTPACCLVHSPREKVVEHTRKYLELQGNYKEQKKTIVFTVWTICSDAV